MEEPGYTTKCLCLVGLRTEVRGKETNLLFPYVKEVNILEICGGGESLLFIYFSLQGQTFSIWKFQNRSQIRPSAAGLHTATAMWDVSCVCDLLHSSRQHQILILLREARDPTHILVDTCQVHFCRATMELLVFLGLKKINSLGTVPVFYPQLSTLLLDKANPI